MSRWAVNDLVGYEWAVAIAYGAGMVTAFLLARLFVFEPASGDMHGQFVRFTMVNALGFVQVWLVSDGLARLVFPFVKFTWHPDTVAHVIGVASPVLVSYVLHKHFSFRSERLLSG